MRKLFIHNEVLSDEELMRLVCRDSSSAFEEIYRRHAPAIHSFLFRRLQDDRELIPDYTQDVFMRLWLSRYRYDGTMPLRPWLYTIAYNLLRNHYRTIGYTLEFLYEEQCRRDETEEDDTPLRIDKELLDRALRKELYKLPQHHQLLFDLRYTEELSVPQIAQVMQLPEGTIKSRLHTILKHLRQQLKAYEDIR